MSGLPMYREQARLPTLQNSFPLANSNRVAALFYLCRLKLIVLVLVIRRHSKSIRIHFGKTSHLKRARAPFAAHMNLAHPLELFLHYFTVAIAPIIFQSFTSNYRRWYHLQVSMVVATYYYTALLGGSLHSFYEVI